MPAPIPMIMDGDPGTDDLLTWMWALACPQQVEMLGICTVHGNVGLDQTTSNALALLDWLGVEGVPVHAGAAAPLGKATAPAGDGAFAESGLGALTLPPATRDVDSHDAVGWMAKLLRDRPSGTVTLCATGPLTNLALLLQTHPDAFARIGRLAIMGGSFDLLPPNHQRRGNITPWAEFNFYMDPMAAQLVLNAGLPVLLLPLDATHQLVSDPDRMAAARALPRLGAEIALMLDAAAHLDKPKFGTEGAFQHDTAVLAALLHPDLFATKPVRVQVVTAGEAAGACLAVPDATAPVSVVEKVRDPAGFYSAMFSALSRISSRLQG